jgi:hypothetical protein
MFFDFNLPLGYEHSEFHGGQAGFRKKASAAYSGFLPLPGGRSIITAESSRCLQQLPLSSACHQQQPARES